MFTGIVEEIGTVRAVRRGAHSSVLSIGAVRIQNGLKIGDSVAVNGVCLTVCSKDSGRVYSGCDARDAQPLFPGMPLRGQPRNS